MAHSGKEGKVVMISSDGSSHSADDMLWKQVSKFVKSQNLSENEVKKIFSSNIYNKLSDKSSNVPVSIFNNEKLSVLEAVVKYLREIQELTLKDISVVLNRNNKTIWTTYNNASKKMPEAFVLEAVSIRIPLELFQDRNSSPLEVVVNYMKDKLGFKNHEIAQLLHRNQKTIWTTYNRKKR